MSINAAKVFGESSVFCGAFRTVAPLHCSKLQNKKNRSLHYEGA
jgi:hypothetical protein